MTSKTDNVYFNPDDRNEQNVSKALEDGSNISSKDKVSVSAKKLSHFLKEIDFQPEYIFMDIQGFEVEVFEDFSNGYLKLHRPIIVFETHPEFYKGPKDLNFILDILSSNEYDYRQNGGNFVCFPK